MEAALTALLLGTLASRGESVYESEYSVEKSKRYVEFSGIAYCSDPFIGKNTVDNWSCKFCKNYPNVTATSFEGPIATQAKGYVAYDGEADEILVVFSGTDPLNIANWIDDIDTIKTDYPHCASTGCRVHEGFYRSYQSVDEDVKKLVGALVAEHPNAPVAITGHSLGAALAAHAVAELSMSGVQHVQASYTYGMPRVGDDAFQQWYKDTMVGTYRVTHHKDPVPHLPTQSMGFHHVPYEAFYKGDNFEATDGQLCSFEGEDKGCSDQYKVDANVLDHLHYMGFDFTTNYLSWGCEF